MAATLPAAEEDLRGLVHELQVHQAELQIQNEELQRARDALDESNARYADFYDFAPVGYFTLDRNGVIREANLFGASLLGVDRSRLLRRPFWRFIAAEQHAAFFDFLARVFAEKDPLTCEVPTAAGAKDRRQLRVEAAAAASGSECWAVVIDVTATKQAQEASRESEERFRKLAEIAPIGVCLTDENGRCTFANSKWLEMAGLSYDEALGEGWIQGIHPDDRPGALQSLKRMAGSGGKVGFECRFQTRTGKTTDVYTLASPILDAAGRTTGYVGTSTDITEFRQVQESLRRSEAQYRAVAETQPDGFWIVDAEGRLLEVNEAYVRRSGYSREELLAIRISDLEALEGTDEARKHMKEVAREGTELFESAHRAKDGKVFPVEVSVSYWPIEGGRFFAFIRDISRRKRAEFLLRARVELSHLGARKDLDAVLQYALDTAELLTGSSIGFFHFVDADQTHLTLQAWSSNTLRGLCTAEGKGNHYPISRAGVWVDCARTLAPVIHNDYASLPHRKGLPPGHAPLVRELVVPILRDGKLIAIVGVGNKSTDYTDDDVEPLQELGSFAMEVAARKQSEEALHRSEAALREAVDYTRSLIEASLDPLVTIRVDGRIGDANAATERATGFTRAELIGTEFPSYFTDPARARVGYMRVFQTGQVRDYPLQLRHRDGRVTEVLYNAALYRNKRGEVSGAFAAARDVTELKRAETALREAYERLNLYMENSPLAVVEWGSDSRIVRWAGDAPKVFGWTAGEVLGKRIDELPWVYEQDLPLVKRAMADMLSGEHPTNVNKNRNVRKNGSVIHCEWYNTSIRDASGHLVSVLSQVVDVTARKRAEEEMSRLLDQTRRDAKTKELLLQEVSHRVKNNLLSLLGLLLVEKRATPPEGHAWVEASISRVSDRIRGMLSAHEMLSEAEWAPLPLADLSERLVRQCLDPAISAGQVSVEVTPSGVRVSPRQVTSLALVLNELATNSLKYAVSKQEHVGVTVRIEEEDECCILQYRDDGPGYPEAVLGEERSSVGLGLISNLTTGTLGGSLALSNDGGAVATIRIRKEDLATT